MQRFVSRRARSFFTAAVAVLVLGGVAYAQAPITFTAGDRIVGKAFTTNPKVAIPAYQITFITAQQGTAVANIEARSRLTSVLANVDQATMKRLTNEAYADLKSKLLAANVPLATDEEARGAIAGLEMLPGNMEIKPITAGVTIGGGVQKAWAAFGADAAPAAKVFIVPVPDPRAQMGMIGANRVMSQGSRKIGSALLIPSLVFDFADTGTSTGRGMLGNANANVSTKVGFSLRANSSTILVSTIPQGPAVGFGGALIFAKDRTNPTPFATVQTGEAAVRALSTGSTDGLGNRNTRGDAVVVDPGVWEGLVREAFQAYNAALVAAVVKGRG